jgi:hypothetical protein
MKRLIVALMVGGALFAAAVGLAASLDVVPGSLGSGGAEVVSCDDEVQVWWNYSWDNPSEGMEVPYANVCGIDADCDGYHIVVTLTKEGNWLAQTSGYVDAAEDCFQANFSSPPLASDITDVHVLIADDGTGGE